MPKTTRPGPSPPKRARRGRKPRVDPQRVTEIFRRFAAHNPEPKGELEYANPFTLLVAVVLLCWNARWLVLLAPGLTRPRRMALAACAVLPITATCIAAWKAQSRAAGRDSLILRLPSNRA